MFNISVVDTRLHSGWMQLSTLHLLKYFTLQIHILRMIHMIS